MALLSIFGVDGVSGLLAGAIHLPRMTASHENTPREVEIGKRTENLKARPDLCKASLANRGKAKNSLHHQQRGWSPLACMRDVVAFFACSAVDKGRPRVPLSSAAARIAAGRP